MAEALREAVVRAIRGHPAKLGSWLGMILADLLRRPGADPEDVKALSALCHCLAWPTESEVCAVNATTRPIILIHRFLLTPAYRPLWPAFTRVLSEIQREIHLGVRKIDDVDKHLGKGVSLLNYERRLATAYGEYHVRAALSLIEERLGSRCSAFRATFTLLMGPPQRFMGMELADVLAYVGVDSAMFD